MLKVEDLNSGGFFRYEAPLDGAGAGEAPAAPDPGRPADRPPDGGGERAPRRGGDDPEAGPAAGRAPDRHDPLRHPGHRRGREGRLRPQRRDDPHRRRAPFTVELDLGDLPRTHSLRAIAYGPDGKEGRADEILVNSGGSRFRVAPHRAAPGPDLRGVDAHRRRAGGAGRRHGGPGRAVPERDPGGDPLRRALVAAGGGAAGDAGRDGLRAGGGLPGGRQLHRGHGVRQRAVVHGGGRGSVRRALHHGARPFRPAGAGAGRSDFRVFEEGEEQAISRFEQVRDLPIHAGDPARRLRLDGGEREPGAGPGRGPRRTSSRPCGRRIGAPSSPSTTGRTWRCPSPTRWTPWPAASPGSRRSAARPSTTA